ncbi:SDR family NAD(P)-dependent oxidoreductase [Parafrankia sp. FMc2]|uniref:SDR family NAD(P)-dependent oxidoreductase n=1 Tax=Parafrankia sp. FMc2 TaxID=3233196 RepID=UPI0034D4CC47
MPYVAPDSVILVTGASGGIGFEIASQAAAGGATVGVHGSRPDSVADAVTRLRALHPDARTIAAPGDFRAEGVIDDVVAKIVTDGGRLDAVIHCAITGAGGTTGLFAHTDPTRYGLAAQYMVGVFQQLCFAARPHLARQGGAVVGFVSDAGRFAAPHQSIIGAAFGGMIAFARNLSTEISRDGVRINIISPSYVVDTPIYELRAAKGRTATAVKRAGLGLPSPKDIAPTALFLCGPDSTKITGQVVSINGGMNA